VTRRKGIMMVSRKMKLVHAVLYLLGGEPPNGDNWRWTQLQTKFMIKTGASPAEFYQIIKYCLQREWVRKPQRGVYIRTEKGEALFEVL